MQKYLRLLLLVSAPLVGLSQENSFFELSDTFFQKYVDEDGGVDYTTIKSNRQMMNDLVSKIAEFDLDGASEPVQKAFLINAYNILVIQQVVDLLPLKSPLDNEAFFNGISHPVAGKDLTLDQLEKETLYKMFPDPRLHFVLVCAAKSCPPLAQMAFVPGSLEQQVEERTKWVMNLPWFILVNDSTVQFSQIFNWYSADFGGTEESLLKYVNRYRDGEIKGKDIGYYEYDWTLNAKDI